MQRLASLRYDYEKWTNIKNKCTDLNEIATVALNEKDESLNDSIYPELSKLSSMVETFELMIRSWHVSQRSIRPDHRMIGHTGFITTARKCVPLKN